MLDARLSRYSTEPKQLNNHAENRLLAALTRKDFRLLLPDLETVALPLNEILCRCGDVIRYVYFPVDSVISLLSEVEEDRSTLEIGVVGNEGMAGIAVFLGVKKSRNRMIVQGAGTALRMKAAALRGHSNGGGRLQSLLQLYTHALLTQVSQSAACNRFHLVEARLARWLLAMRDRIGSNEFQLTQEFLSNMLGVRREMVNKAAGTLQKQGLISYTRGILTILDNAGLETATCACYRSIKEEYDNFLD
ncbi:MAG: Crp/Fnr family transcriptional regulator [Acidobacteriota bacterium]|nr:Crp/Fnr family transcriptional regulator [Acidobacteriota bacterium]